MSDYVAAKLIEAMGMFIHDLWALRGDTEGVYDEEAYYDIAKEILKNCNDVLPNRRLTEIDG